MWQVIYIAPLKALVRERMDGWGKGLARSLNKKLVRNLFIATLTTCVVVFHLSGSLAILSTTSKTIYTFNEMIERTWWINHVGQFSQADGWMKFTTLCCCVGGVDWRLYTWYEGSARSWYHRLNTWEVGWYQSELAQSQLCYKGLCKWLIGTILSFLV